MLPNIFVRLNKLLWMLVESALVRPRELQLKVLNLLLVPEDDSSNPLFTSPRKKYKRAKYATGIDDFDADIVRRTVHEFYDNHEYPTSTKVLRTKNTKKKMSTKDPRLQCGEF